MRSFILSVVATGLSVGVLAAGPGGKGGNGGGGKPAGSGMSSPVHATSFKASGPHSSYHQTYGKSFSHGVFYSGKHHNFWNYKCYSPRYGCECYWCPSASCYYYWCQPSNCYYPISYIAYAPPVCTAPVCTAPVCAPPVSGPPACPTPAPYVVQTQTQTQVQGVGAGGPPAGVPPPPQ